MQVKAEIDARGLKCPEPVMMLHAQVRDAKAGECIRVFATDPSTLRDIPNFCDFLNHTLVESQEQEENDNALYVFLVKKGK